MNPDENVKTLDEIEAGISVENLENATVYT